MFWRHYVYIHKQADTGITFYVGKGTIRKRKKSPDYERAFARSSRSDWWNKIVKKHGLEVEITAMFETDKDAQEYEKYLILRYGRRQTGSGELINLTDGGDGHSGVFISDDLRQKRSNNAKCKRSSKWIKSIRRARKNGGNGNVVCKGDKLPESWKENISKGQKGPNNYMRGRTGGKAPKRRVVINIDTNEIYPTVSIAAESVGMKMKTLYNMLSGHRNNTTELRFS